MKALFGTDGIRGKANVYPMTAEVALQLGRAAGNYFRRGSHRHTVVLGKDTRLSGYMIEHALVAGFTSAGMDVRMIGPCPTPAVGLLTRSMRADLGVMVTASHNPHTDNGIKLFGPDGFKLDDNAEATIEALMQKVPHEISVPSEEIGQVSAQEDSRGRYVEAAKASFDSSMSLTGLKVVVDCANGAGYRTTPQALWELGAEVLSMGVSPNGFNINADCGATAPEAMARRVVETGANLGVALDGDGDRLIVADERGSILDGDQILGLICLDRHAAGRLTGGGAVATVMSNLGLARRLEAEGLKLERTAVGDRYVVERMRQDGFNVGGEQSGHIVLLDHVTTGDGLVAALQVLSACLKHNKPASEVCRVFEPVPQVLRSIAFKGRSPLDNPSVRAACIDCESQLGKSRRLVVRASGTEPVIRVMLEGDDQAQIDVAADELAGVIRASNVDCAAE